VPEASSGLAVDETAAIATQRRLPKVKGEETPKREEADMIRRRSRESAPGGAARARRGADALLRRAVTLTLTLATLALAARDARAQESNGPSAVQTYTAVPVAPVPPNNPGAVPLDENTARMIGARRLKLGIFAFDYGVTDHFSFGVDPPEYALKSFTSILVPNLHFKGMFVRTSVVEVSGQVAGYYASISNSTASGRLLVIPLTLYVSVKLASPVWLHLEGAYNFSRAIGSGDLSRANIDGAVVMRTAQAGAMLEFRLTRVVALTARGRYQFYSTPIIAEGSSMLDPFTTATASLEAQSPHPHPAMGVAAVALTWKHVGVIAGGGYGHYFLPGANLALSYKGIIPEASLWAVF
jgi:hypothetical protein